MHPTRLGVPISDLIVILCSGTGDGYPADKLSDAKIRPHIIKGTHLNSPPAWHAVPSLNVHKQPNTPTADDRVGGICRVPTLSKSSEWALCDSSGRLPACRQPCRDCRICHCNAPRRPERLFHASNRKRFRSKLAGFSHSHRGLGPRSTSWRRSVSLRPQFAPSPRLRPLEPSPRKVTCGCGGSV